MDNGEVLQGLNEDWSFLGANLGEWLVGFVVFLMISLFGASPARMMPFMIMGWIGTTVALAVLRNMFPDQERGVRNALMTLCRFPPPGIPAPARIQPIWSASPVKELPERCRFLQVGLDSMFPSFKRDLYKSDGV